MIETLFWRPFAWLVSRKPIAEWIIARAQAKPYYHLDGYMNRWWLFNGYPPNQEKEKPIKWLPSIRIHHILREDRGRDLHNHPWDARTIILKGSYNESRLLERFKINFKGSIYPANKVMRNIFRQKGDTATLTSDDFHSIDKVSEGGVWTMFITYQYQGTWGFLVEDKFVKHTEYTGVP